jgi:hypothetical protein
VAEFEEREDKLHRAHAEETTAVCKSAIEKDDVPTGWGGWIVVAELTAKSFIASVYERPIVSCLRALQCFEEVGTLTDLVWSIGAAILRADFALAREKDAGDLERCKKLEIVRLSEKNLVKCAAAD